MHGLKEAYEKFEQEKKKAFGQLYTQWANTYPEVNSIYWEYENHWTSPLIAIRHGKFNIEWDRELRLDFDCFCDDIGMDVIRTCPKKNIIELDDYRNV